MVPSESSRADIITDMGLPDDWMHTVPLGTDHEVFSPDPSVARVPGRIVVVTSADVPLKGLSVLLEALPKIIGAAPDTRVVVLSGHTSPAARLAARELGAHGYLDKTVSGDRLVKELLAVVPDP